MFKKYTHPIPRLIDIDDMELEDYKPGFVYISKEKQRYCFAQESAFGFVVGTGREDVPENDPRYSRNTGAMPFKQAQRVMYDFMNDTLQ